MLQGARIAVTGHRKGAELATLLERRGAEVLLGPTTSGDVAAPDDEIAADTRAIVASDPRWMVATTGVGMRVWIETAARVGLAADLAAVAANTRWVARGAKAVGGMAGLKVTPDWVSPNNTDSDVVSWLSQRILPGEVVAVQQHGGYSTVYDALGDVGADLLTVMPYRWGLPDDPGPAHEVIYSAVAEELDVIMFTSAGAVQNLFLLAEQLGEDVSAGLARALAGVVAVASVGPVTAEAVEAHGGINTIVPRRWRTADLVRGTEAWWARRDAVVTDLGLQLVPSRSAVLFKDTEVELGPREYAVLAALSRRPGVLVRSEELLTEAWGHQAPADTGTVKHQVSRLRRKLEGSDVQIETVRGVGYRIGAAP